MAVESDFDLEAFTNPGEFGVSAILQFTGDVALLADGAFAANGQEEADGITSALFQIPIDGIPSTAAAQERGGALSRSSMSSVMTGAADVRIQTTQFLTAWHKVQAVVVDNYKLVIPSGEYAGEYRIRDKQRDGSMARLNLNKL